MNRLKDESSPYLLQHKDNPVHWWPWSQEALDSAHKEDKIILLSIGYSACHWCHVMEKECFEDHEVAELMNKHFVNIKVDREERPDLDHLYMDALHMMGLQGGWPLNVFLLPTGEPIYGGTYFPKKKWMGVLRSLLQVFTERRDEVEASGEGFRNSLQNNELIKFAKTSSEIYYTKEEASQMAENLSAHFDVSEGGMDRAPKFPMPSLWQMVAHLAQFTENDALREHYDFTLGRMTLGGIFDHVGGGWCRYSTDAYWMVPHFEKMLYDNAQLLALHQQYPTPISDWACRKTVQWLDREMKVASGGYYAALDADSEGEEGRYYVWTEEELKLASIPTEVLNEYGISERGNWEEGKNILHLEHWPKNWDEIKESHEKLLEIRQNRVRPGLDNKLITSWNALLVNGLMGVEPDKAKDLMDYLLASHTFLCKNEDGEEALGCFHLGKNDKILGFLDDYASLILASIEVYSHTFDETYLEKARIMINYVLANFYDPEDGFFFYTDSQAERLIAKKKEIYDNVIPSSNSMMAKALYFGGRYLAEREYVKIAEDMVAKIQPMTLKDAQWLSNWVDLILYMSEPQIEWVITGPEAMWWAEVLKNKRKTSSTLILAGEKESQLPLFHDKFLAKTALFVCENQACQLPIFDLNEL
ncbi:thioredoxin domain-containing protein [Leadbetterella byssophila]|uniref:thioredoxin domain-containing protein n=1 Tax=Leadbetterella byssophila TaxID=316068 RepID=UPI0039A282F3